MNELERGMMIAINLEQAQRTTERKIVQMLYCGPKFSRERVMNEERKKQVRHKKNVLSILSRRNQSLDT